MKRDRRSQLIAETYRYHADLVEAMVSNGDGIYNIGDTEEEHQLVRDTTILIADMLHRRGSRKRR